MVIWITGLSGSGKTTIGNIVSEIWKAREANTVIVDGDVIRRILKMERDDVDYTMEGRRPIAERIHRMCAWLDVQSINVVCCTMSLFNDIQLQNRSTFSNYFEVYLSVPMEKIYKRDQKNLYAPALRGEKKNVIGVDLPFTVPAHFDLKIDNSDDHPDFSAIAKNILDRALNIL